MHADEHLITNRDRARLPQVAAVVLRTLEQSAKTRRTVLCLLAVLAYLLIGRAIDPGFTDYWWYQLAQTSGTLAVVVALEVAFRREGGLAWQTHAIVVATTVADTLGTAGHMYDAWGPYDKVVHFWSGAAGAAGAYEVLRLLDRRGVARFSARRRAALAIAASLAVVGVLWELYEYLSDALFNSGRVQGRTDTVNDLISDALGAVAAVGLLFFRERKTKRHADRSVSSAMRTVE